MPITKIYFESIDSTQDESKRLIQSNNQNLTQEQILIIWADSQSQGRGRFGRTWVSPEGKGIYFSISKQIQNSQTEAQSEIEFATSITKEIAELVIRALQDHYQEKYQSQILQDLYLQPINDIYYQDKKLAGILIETINHQGQKFLIIGIGINLKKNSEKLPETTNGKNAQAISLEEIFEQNDSIEFDYRQDTESIIDAIAERFLKKYSSL